MNCANCGHDVPDDALVCPNCGRAVEPAPGPDAASRVPPPLDDTASPSRSYAADARERAASSGFANHLVERVKNLLVTPRTEWPVIAAEATTAQDIYLRYVAPLVAIGVVASFIGSVLVGIPVPALGTVRLGLGSGLAAAIVHFLLTFFSIFVVALIVDALAPTFGGERDRLRALKVTAYSFTPAWIAAILTILPALGFLAGLIGLYGLYLMYVGLPVLMRSPQDKALGYTAVVVLCAIILSIVISAITALVTGGYGPPA